MAPVAQKLGTASQAVAISEGLGKENKDTAHPH